LHKAVRTWCHPAGHVAHVPYATCPAEISAKHFPVLKNVVMVQCPSSAKDAEVRLPAGVSSHKFGLKAFSAEQGGPCLHAAVLDSKLMTTHQLFQMASGTVFAAYLGVPVAGLSLQQPLVHTGSAACSCHFCSWLSRTSYSAEHSLQLRQQESWQERQSFDATLRCWHEDCTSQVAGGSAAAAWGSSNKQQCHQQ